MNVKQLSEVKALIMKSAHGDEPSVVELTEEDLARVGGGTTFSCW